MKAFLMYRARDFDPEQMLVRWNKESRFRRNPADHAAELQNVLPWNAAALTQDLGLDIVLNAMSGGDEFLFEVAKVALMSSLTDIDTINYRQHILADALQNFQIVHEMYQITIDAMERERKGIWGGFIARYPAGILGRAIEVLQVFVEELRRLRNIADLHADRFESEGFSQLLSMLKKELSDEYFATIESHLRRAKFRGGVLISARLGQGNKGRNYALRWPHTDSRGWLDRLFAEMPQSYSYELHPRDEAGARALSELTDRGLNLVANALAQSMDHIGSFLQMLRTELAFYIGCINLHHRLAQIGEPSCFPIAGPSGRRTLSFADLYDASLALNMGRKVVANDLRADRSELVIITGANTGGKSTFLRSVALAQLMMQAGMFVGATSFSSDVCDGLFTHYKREEDASMESGKWDEELSRMSEIVTRLRPNSVVFFNESFASTNEREGSEIANQIVHALLAKQIRVFFVTHLYHFAHTFFIERPDRCTFLRAVRRSDGTRSFKLASGAPLQTSYGQDLCRAIFGDGENRTEGAAQRTDNAATV
jgi:DNA mismatch repair ATPase MutS